MGKVYNVVVVVIYIIIVPWSNTLRVSSGGGLKGIDTHQSSFKGHAFDDGRQLDIQPIEDVSAPRSFDAFIEPRVECAKGKRVSQFFWGIICTFRRYWKLCDDWRAKFDG